MVRNFPISINFLIDQYINFFSQSHPPSCSFTEAKLSVTKKKEQQPTNNNAYIPKTTNQMSKNEKLCVEKSSVKSKRNNVDVSPSESQQKAQNIVGSDVCANEKSQAAVSAHLNKVRAYTEKLCQYLDYLQAIINEPPQLDDRNDLNRRQKRSLEFTNRFARNHLYQIGRLVSLAIPSNNSLLSLTTTINFLHISFCYLLFSSYMMIL